MRSDFRYSRCSQKRNRMLGFTFIVVLASVSSAKGIPPFWVLAGVPLAPLRVSPEASNASEAPSSDSGAGQRFVGPNETVRGGLAEDQRGGGLGGEPPANQPRQIWSNL